MESVNLHDYPIQDTTLHLLSRENSSPNLPTPTSNPHATIESAINTIFPAQSEENNFTRTRKYLGETAKSLTDEQIESVYAQFQFLIDSWLDEYEKEVFSGKTLKEVLNAV